MRFLPIYKSCSFIKSCGKPTITSTTMQERHDNNEIEPHNHNKYPLLYKEAEISMSSLGKFLECRKCYILLVTCALVIYLICMPSALGLRAYISGKSLVPMLQLLHKLSHARMFSRPKILFLVSLLFVALLNSIPTYLLNFEFFYHSS